MIVHHEYPLTFRNTFRKLGSIAAQLGGESNSRELYQSKTLLGFLTNKRKKRKENIKPQAKAGMEEQLSASE